MSESKLTPGTLAMHGLCAFVTYKALEKICCAFSGFGLSGYGYGGPILATTARALSSDFFVPVCCALCAFPLIIKLAGAIRRKYTKRRNDFGGDDWYDEYIAELEHPNRQDKVQQDRVSQHQ